MRTIKFRMWSIKDKFMDDTPVVYKGAPCTINSDGEIVWMPQDDTVLMQFTGLLDKNGKEIYEGDVMHHDEMKAHAIEFQEGRFGKFYIDYSLCEVIGNIYENPELIN